MIEKNTMTLTIKPGRELDSMAGKVTCNSWSANRPMFYFDINLIWVLNVTGS